MRLCWHGRSARPCRRHPDPRPQPTIAILGAGISGLCMGIRLKLAGIDSFTIFEKSQRVGGTWYDNSYPGAGCDVPSHLYSFSFEPNPDWSRKFSPQDEIQRYLERCAEKYGLLPHIRFGTEIAGASFDEGEGVWRLRTGSGRIARGADLRRRLRPAEPAARSRSAGPGRLPGRQLPLGALGSRALAGGPRGRRDRQRRQRHPVHPADREAGEEGSPSTSVRPTGSFRAWIAPTRRRRRRGSGASRSWCGCSAR